MIFWSGRSLLRDELPRDWQMCDLQPWDGYAGSNPVPCPRPLEQERYSCDSIRADFILDPFLGTGTTILAGNPAPFRSRLHPTSDTRIGSCKRCSR
ncbi:MAG: hypothetical protein SF069_08595 [Phycisphaerae bacterium]|nr:hypothetical protein [Phycisphaerae bacterium]